MKKIKRLYNKLYYKAECLYYYVKDYFWPHNVVKCQSLPRSWNDRDERILHCCFQILTDFIEQEQPWWMKENWTSIKNSMDAEYADEVSQLKRLYYWWKFVYVKKYLEQEEIFLKETDIVKLYEQEMLFYNEETNKAIEILQLRKYLWT